METVTDFGGQWTRNIQEKCLLAVIQNYFKVMDVFQ